jgi:hypothetical protein
VAATLLMKLAQRRRQGGGTTILGVGAAVAFLVGLIATWVAMAMFGLD